MADDSLEKAIAEFVGAFEVVFRYDWEYTSAVMTGTVMDDENFIESGLAEDSNDWGAGGALLEKYQALVLLMKSRGIKPSYPFPLERLENFKGVVW